MTDVNNGNGIDIGKIRQIKLTSLPPGLTQILGDPQKRASGGYKVADLSERLERPFGKIQKQPLANYIDSDDGDGVFVLFAEKDGKKSVEIWLCDEFNPGMSPDGVVTTKLAEVFSFLPDEMQVTGAFKNLNQGKESYNLIVSCRRKAKDDHSAIRFDGAAAG